MKIIGYPFRANTLLFHALLITASTASAMGPSLIENKSAAHTIDNTTAFTIKAGGRIMFDLATYYDDKQSLNSGNEFRRARLFIKGTLLEDFLYKIQYDFAGSTPAFKDAWLGYKLLNNSKLRIGQFSQPVTLEDTVSSNDIMFMERALPILSFAPGRNLGIDFTTHGKFWSFTSGIFLDSKINATQHHEGWSIATRLTTSAALQSDNIFHLGASTRYHSPSNNKISLGARPEAHIDETKLVSTGTLDNIDSNILLGIESAWINSSLTIHAEYIHNYINRHNSLNSVHFNGYYISSGYILTGEKRPYDSSNGTFGRIIPKQSYGAWELALRFSKLNLNNGATKGGKQQNTTLGLNWYTKKPSLRFMLNYTMTNTDKYANDDDPSILQFRTQLNF